MRCLCECVRVNDLGEQRRLPKEMLPGKHCACGGRANRPPSPARSPVLCSARSYLAWAVPVAACGAGAGTTWHRCALAATCRGGLVCGGWASGLPLTRNATPYTHRYTHAVWRTPGSQERQDCARAVLWFIRIQRQHWVRCVLIPKECLPVLDILNLSYGLGIRSELPCWRVVRAATYSTCCTRGMHALLTCMPYWHDRWSTTKSLCSTLFGIARENGWATPATSVVGLSCHVCAHPTHAERESARARERERERKKARARFLFRPPCIDAHPHTRRADTHTRDLPCVADTAVAVARCTLHGGADSGAAFRLKFRACHALFFAGNVGNARKCTCPCAHAPMCTLHLSVYCHVASRHRYYLRGRERAAPTWCLVGLFRWCVPSPLTLPSVCVRVCGTCDA